MEKERETYQRACASTGLGTVTALVKIQLGEVDLQKILSRFLEQKKKSNKKGNLRIFPYFYLGCLQGKRFWF